MIRHDIPGFRRYFVTQPFDIIDRKTGDPVRHYVAHRGQRGHDRVHVLDDAGKRRTLSVITLAALAFHGQSPEGYIAFLSGNEITPNSVKWLPKQQVYRMRRQQYTEWQRHEMSTLYFDEGWTQQRIADKYGLSQVQVSRAIGRRLR